MSAKSSSLSLLSKAIELALNQGYQVTPDALKLLQSLAEKKRTPAQGPVLSLESIVFTTLEDKAKKKEDNLSKTITSGDLARVFPDLFESQFLTEREVAMLVDTSPYADLEGMKNKQERNHSSSSAIPVEIEIVKDPSKQIQPTGTEGFAQLFKSRYEKLYKIFQERPEGRQVVKIQKLNMDKGNAKILGLVLSKRPTKNGIELIIDDDSGKASVLALSEEAKKTAAFVSLDQCILLDVEAKQGRLILKSIIQPDVPNHGVCVQANAHLAWRAAGK